jgi:predicted O-methyltransferase YrrM
LKKLATFLAISGVLVSLTGVAAAYLIKTYWLPHFNWDLVTAKTNLALVLGGLFFAMAFWARALSRTDPEKRPVKPALFISLCGILVLIAGTFVIGTILRIHDVTTLTATWHSSQDFSQSQYKFTRDWVSPYKESWTKHLQHLRGKPAHGLEIGTFEGRSALWFLENILTNPDASITCVDIFPAPYEQRFDANVVASGLERKIKKVKGDSKFALRTFPRDTYDFVYVDGSHDAKDVLSDAVLAWELLKPGGVMIFDDYQWTGSAAEKFRPARIPEIAIDAFLHVYEPYMDVVQKDYQVIVRKREKADLDGPRFGLLTMARKLIY